MSAPSLTLRSLENEETGIDISVPRFQEEEAPLGGVSILYEIAVLTRLELFKNRLHRNEDVVQFSIYKAYREVEDLYNKLNKKYPKAALPPVPSYASIDKYTSEEKVTALDRFVKAVAKDVEMCHCSTFTHFIGSNSQRLPSFTVPNTNLPSAGLRTENIKVAEKVVKVSEDLSEVSPKVKNVAPKTGNIKPVQSVSANNYVDLFEELVKEAEKICDVRGNTSGGLFDDFEGDSFFNSPKPVSPPKEEKKVSEVKPKRKEPKKKTSEINVDDSEIIIKERKLGDISLFDERDLEDYVTKDEESLLLISSNNEKTKQNTLLFSSDIESVEPDSEVSKATSTRNDFENVSAYRTRAKGPDPSLRKEYMPWIGPDPKNYRGPNTNNLSFKEENRAKGPQRDFCRGPLASPKHSKIAPAESSVDTEAGNTRSS